MRSYPRPASHFQECSRFSLTNFNSYLKRVVRESLREDLGPGDITTDTLFPRDRTVKAQLIAKENLVFACKQVFEETFRQAGGSIKIRWLKNNGQKVRKNSIICELSGSLRTVLKGERLALNMIQRLSGISTLTDKFVKKLNSRRIQILDTRKTTPMLRTLEKYAVRLGGGKNHRMGLYDRVFVKDNHIKAKGSILDSMKVLKDAGRLQDAVIETASLIDVREAIECGAKWILLDNMNISQIKKAVKIIAKRAKIEVSGGIDLINISKLKGLGINYVSVGALTHSSRSMDISLNLK